MSIQIDDVVNLHLRAMNLRVERSEVLAANLANESTPGFQAKDIDFAAEMQRIDKDFSFSGDEQINNPNLKYRLPMQPSQDGNTVDLSTEQAVFAKNSMDFQMSLTFISQKFRGLKQAIEGR